MLPVGSLGGWLSQTKAQVSVMPVRLIAGTVATCVGGFKGRDDGIPRTCPESPGVSFIP